MTLGQKTAIALELYAAGLLCKCHNWQPIEGENSVRAESAEKFELQHEPNCEGKKNFKEILNFSMEAKK